MPDRPGYSFGDGAPREVSEFLRRKDWRPAFSWESVEPAEHAVAFTVAKATSMDVLETIRDAVQEAIDDGVPFERFRQQLQPVLEAKGWWGRRDVVDPDTGETVSAQLGSPRRLRVIYQANLRSARAAGQWERIQRAKRGLPFLLYQLGPSERRRPHHASKEGWVLPVDDPFWEKWMPPNGWGCKCHVRQISRSEAERRGLIDAPKIPDVEVENSRTGEVRRVPQGIDPCWDTNPGLERSRADGLRLAEKIAA
ncbi:MAG: phage minor head protein, partial [Pseudomonadota bacterium]